MRHWIAILFLSITASPAVSRLNAETPEKWEKDGQALFLACEFKQAARAFEKALAAQTGSAALHYWLGRSYARLAVVSGPLTAPGAARKARRNLEQALMLDPHNNRYASELFEFYVDSPEWFSGGLQRAAALAEGLSPEESQRMKEVDSSREEYSGPGWWLRRTVLRASGAVGFLGIR
jgi:tetratricopeptide (TPR) repeat protein